MAGRALASSQLDGCYPGLFECLHQPGPDFSFPKRSFGKKTHSAVVPTCLVFKIAFNEADDTVFCFTYRKMFKERKKRPLLKQTLLL